MKYARRFWAGFREGFSFRWMLVGVAIGVAADLGWVRVHL